MPPVLLCSKVPLHEGPCPALLLLLSLPALAAELPRVDLDGDGKPDALSLQWNLTEAQGGFTLQVDGARVDVKRDDPNEGGLEVVDLDTGDKWKELAITTGQTEGDHRVYLFGFDGQRLKSLGEVHALTEVRGNGIILSDKWMGFWNRRDKYVLDRAAWTVRAVPQSFYYVGVACKVRQPFALVRARGDKAPVATLAQGSSLQVLTADTSASLVLFLVKSATGLLGWASGPELEKNTEGLPIAG